MQIRCIHQTQISEEFCSFEIAKFRFYSSLQSNRLVKWWAAAFVPYLLRMCTPLHIRFALLYYGCVRRTTPSARCDIRGVLNSDPLY